MPNLDARREFTLRKIEGLNAKPGFTLIEIVLSLLLILAILTVFFAGSGTYTASRGTNLAGIATKIATRQIETLRKVDYASLPSCPSPTGCNISDSDLVKLPSGSAKQFIDTYESSTDIKQVTVVVDWVVSGANKNIKLDTLIYKNGL